MQLIWNRTGSELENLNRAAVAQATHVVAAIAYATDTATLLDACLKANKPLTLYARYDATGPISDRVLNWFLSQSPDYEMLLVPDIFHPKVIWWKGVGAYVGSANLTNRAWGGNIEAGTFMTEEEMEEHGITDDLTDFFAQTKSRAHKLTREIAQHMIELRNTFAAIEGPHESVFERTRKIPRGPSVISITRKRASDRRKSAFLKEWGETLQYLRGIGQMLSQSANQPAWLSPHAASGVIADQFLHAFYYNRVKDGIHFPYREFHKKNKARRSAALTEAVDWWRSLSSAPSGEDEHIGRWAPYVREKLDRANLTRLSEEDFTQVCHRVHAMREHATRLSHQAFGLENRMPTMSRTERIDYFGRWLYSQRTRDGKSPMDVIDFVLYGGSQTDVQERLFEACYGTDWKLPHMGVSTLGEMVGWAMPDVFPPRNGRTSKALTALGYDVDIHSE
jgi:hypothetical protein